MNEQKPEDVMKDMEQYVHCANIMGSATLSKDEMNAIFALLREKDARIEQLLADIRATVEVANKGSAEKDAEIERLQGAVEQYEEERKYHFEMSRKRIAEAIDEFAERMEKSLTAQVNVSSQEMLVAFMWCLDLVKNVKKQLKGEKE